MAFRRFIVAAALACAGICAFGDDALTTLEPNGGEEFRVGDSMTVRWTIDKDLVLNGVVVQVSADRGLTWHTVSGSEAVENDDPDVYESPSADTGTFRWKIARTAGGKSIVVPTARMRVMAPYDLMPFNDPSDDVFEIRQAAGAVWDRCISQPQQGVRIWMSYSGVHMDTREPFSLVLVDARGRVMAQIRQGAAGERCSLFPALACGAYMAMVRTPRQGGNDCRMMVGW